MAAITSVCGCMNYCDSLWTNVVLARVTDFAGLTFVCNPEGGLPMCYTCFLMAAGEPINKFT